MTSESLSPVIHASVDISRNNFYPGPAPPSEEVADPFRSRDGSPNRNRNIPPSFSVDRSADGDSFGGIENRNNIDQGHEATPLVHPSPAQFPNEGRRRATRAATMDTGYYPQRPHTVLDLANVPYVKVKENERVEEQAQEQRRSAPRRTKWARLRRLLGLSDAPTTEESIPRVEVVYKPNTVGYRLQPTITEAKMQRNAFAWTAKWNTYVLNIMSALQVLLGSLTTGLSAAATSGKSAAVATTILGAFSTLVASYLARARGSGEPELSNAKVKILDHFIRECDAVILDDGEKIVDESLNAKVIGKRERLELLLGNMTRGDPGHQKFEASSS